MCLRLARSFPYQVFRTTKSVVLDCVFRKLLYLLNLMDSSFCICNNTLTWEMDFRCEQNEEGGQGWISSRLWRNGKEREGKDFVHSSFIWAAGSKKWDAGSNSQHLESKILLICTYFGFKLEFFFTCLFILNCDIKTHRL